MRKIIKKVISTTLIFSIICMVFPQSVLATEESFTNNMDNAETEVPQNPKDGVWDCVTFGSYPQSEVEGYSIGLVEAALEAGNNGIFYYEDNKYYRVNTSDSSYGFRVFKFEPIKWRVLENDGENLYLLSDKNLGTIRWNGDKKTWETSPVRTLFNGKFLNIAFSYAEQEELIEETLTNDRYPATNGKDPATKDRVWALSAYELLSADYGFLNNELRKSEHTKFATYSSDLSYGGFNSSYDYGGIYYSVSRSMQIGSMGALVYYVSDSGKVQERHLWWNDQAFLYRPAIKIPVSSDLYQKVDSINGDNYKRETYQQTIMNQLPELQFEGDTLKGPEYTFLGKTYNLFSMEMDIDIPLGKNSNVNYTTYYDEENQTVKFMLGITDEEKAKLEASAQKKDSYWRESYTELKTFVQACGGTVDTTKLWNQFSSLRGKLKKVNASMAIAMDGYVLGCLEYRVVDGKLEFMEGSIAAQLSPSVKVKTPIWGFIYTELGLSGEIGSELVLMKDTQKQFWVSGDVHMKLVPEFNLLADVIVAQGRAGISGEIGINVNFPYTSAQESIYAYLTGKAYLRLSTPIEFLNGEMSKNFGKMELYPDFGKIEKTNLPISYAGRMLGSAPEEISNEDMLKLATGPKETAIYENASPKLTELSDGRKLLIYVDDTGEKANGNHTTLMYTIQSDGVWSEPIPVIETGRADSSPVIYNDGNKVHVIWLNTSISATDEVEAEELLKNVDLCYSSFDGATFSEPVIVSEADNGKVEFSYSVSSDGNKVSVLWVDNDANDFWMQSGTNTVYMRNITDGELSEISSIGSSSDNITQTACTYLNGTLVKAYINSGTVYYGTDAMTVVDTNAKSLHFEGGNLYYLNDTLKYYAGEKITNTQIVPENKFQIVNDTVYWISNNNFNSMICAQKIGSSELPITVTEKDGYVSGFSAVKKQDGKVALSYVYQLVAEDFEEGESPYGLSFMKYYEETETYDLILDSVSYDISEVKAGEECTLLTKIYNNSSVEINDSLIIVSDKAGNEIASVDVAETIPVGGSIEKAIAVLLPTELTGEVLKITVKNNAITEKDEENNVCEVELENTDIAISIDQEYRAVISNIGSCKAEAVVLNLYKDNPRGELITSVDIGTLESGGSVKCEDRDLINTFGFHNLTDVENYYYEVTTVGRDINVENNSCYVERSPLAATEVSINEKFIALQVGESAQLKAEIFPTNAYFKDVTWVSDDTTIVTVNENGTVEAKREGVTFIRVATNHEGVYDICAIQVNAEEEERVETKVFEVEDIPDQYYTGHAICPEIVVKSEGKILKKGIDYTVQYMNHVEEGEGIAIVTGIDKYSGVIVKTFKIKIEQINSTTMKQSGSKKMYQVKLKWEKVKDSDGYELYRLNTKNGTYECIKTLSANTYTDKKLKAGQQYFYKIRVYKVVGGKKIYSEFSETISAYTKTAAPTLKVVKKDGKAILSWKKVSGAAGYEIYMSNKKNKNYKRLKVLAKNKQTYTYKKLKRGKTYYFKMRTYSLDNNGKKVYSAYSKIKKLKN